MALRRLLVDVLPADVAPPVGHEAYVRVEVEGVRLNAVPWTHVLHLAEAELFPTVLILNFGTRGVNRRIYLRLVFHCLVLIAGTVVIKERIRRILLIPRTVFKGAIVASIGFAPPHRLPIRGSARPRLVQRRHVIILHYY